MKKILTSILLTVFAAFTFAQAPAAPAKTVIPANALASGTVNGTYWTMTNQYLTQCNPESFFNNMPQPGGSPATISAILDNSVIGGMVQFDVLWLRAQNNKAVSESIRSLVPLHKEQVHVVALSQDPKRGGFMGFNQESVKLKDVSALKGYKVAAAGGSYYTAETINKLSGIDYKLSDNYKTPEDALAAVEKGEAVAAFIVGGAPTPAISALDRSKFRLLPFDAKTIEIVSKTVYYPATIQYDNFGTTGVATVEVDALLVVNDYKSKAMSARLLALRECIKSNIDDIAEAPKAHGAWRQVAKSLSKGEKARWPEYVGRQ